MVSLEPRQLAFARKLLFAALMSCVTVHVVCLVLFCSQPMSFGLAVETWQFFLRFVWPTVFVSILLIAPWLLRLTEWLLPSP